MAQEAAVSPPFFTELFFQQCYDVIYSNFGLDLNRDINVHNALDVSCILLKICHKVPVFFFHKINVFLYMLLVVDLWSSVSLNSSQSSQT